MNELSADPSVVGTVTDFAGRIQDRLTSILPQASNPQLLVRVAPKSNGDARVVVSAADALGIPLHADGAVILRLVLKYECMTSSTSRFLAVESSSFRVNLEGARMPLFTVDYLNNPGSRIPGAHINVHANRKDMTRALDLAGHRFRRKRKSTRPLTLGMLHFPTGGHRFRLCLEDVLEMLILEFALDTKDERWREHIAAGRREWRHVQLAAAVSDDPETAAAELRRLNYTVSPTPDGLRERLDRTTII